MTLCCLYFTQEKAQNMTDMIQEKAVREAAEAADKAARERLEPVAKAYLVESEEADAPIPPCPPQIIRPKLSV
jgi:hypothetical protein